MEKNTIECYFYKKISFINDNIMMTIDMLKLFRDIFMKMSDDEVRYISLLNLKYFDIIQYYKINKKLPNDMSYYRGLLTDKTWNFSTLEQHILNIIKILDTNMKNINKEFKGILKDNRIYPVLFIDEEPNVIISAEAKIIIIPDIINADGNITNKDIDYHDISLFRNIFIIVNDQKYITPINILDIPKYSIPHNDIYDYWYKYDTLYNELRIPGTNLDLKEYYTYDNINKRVIKLEDDIFNNNLYEINVLLSKGPIGNFYRYISGNIMQKRDIWKKMETNIKITMDLSKKVSLNKSKDAIITYVFNYYEYNEIP